MIVKNVLKKLIFFTLLGYGIIVAYDKKDSKTEVKAVKAEAEWTLLTYIAADNNLASFANYNINDMIKGIVSTKNANILVQWDQPNNRKTWRYKITSSGKVDAGSITSEMGYNPAKELVASLRWAKQNFPAKKYAVILWNHGSGIEDFYPGSRGILYDDTQGTCLTNAGLTSALTEIKGILGKNIDLVATDACLMSMVEVVYQIKGLANTFVGSQETIPGTGYPYSRFIKPLTKNPTTTNTPQLAALMVDAYKTYYSSVEPTPSFTLSAINVTQIDSLKQNIDQFVAAVNACNEIDSVTTQSMIQQARSQAIYFEMPEYIDLYSFYAGILNRTKKISPKSQIILSQREKNKNTTKVSPQYQQALNTLTSVINDGINKITTIVLSNATGSIYSGAQGISIYYPETGSLDSSYLSTLFAQDSSWVNFLNSYR